MTDGIVPSPVRQSSFGQDHEQSLADRFGIWLSKRAVARAAGDLRGKVVADLGCGYHAEFAMTYAETAARVVLADVSLDPALKANPNVVALEGGLPDSLAGQADSTIDFIVANNIVEHLLEAQKFISECRRMLRPDGKLFVNVPSWRGKWFLEYSAFKLGLSPAEEMNDHKMYYDPRDLWVLLIGAGFVPQDVVVRKHKFGLNVRAVARKGSVP